MHYLSDGLIPTCDYWKYVGRGWGSDCSGIMLWLCGGREEVTYGEADREADNSSLFLE